ncbi:MAG: hypothetical protein L6243_04300 [Candidatus Altiarchaeales archaeon]|nr:C/D box methylation guide ribonucleoprotein complex aNOP56 subunit [Candidatus Altiarchaeota archaeon]MBU4341492.1 C/D box methylation guide ribonucleoprotein complex aNOP56 subunit [Candidatus Altiarchaeota archaeon]MBU4406017.1 C/D box methylation guide ribonucleoprotein complex aNOP56 subunit [Candidatus Altiarchaeota archaeon]MBU4437034.1 C/D box methylation guide ribonucleoprotein complex aNOP56 subunit [Candidatus Altiarchaeota archaeon]MCG2782790.1 hypothetical protein [Candidatus Alt
MIQLTTNVLGVFAVRKGKVIEKVLFPDKPTEIADRLERIQGSFCDEEKGLIEKLKKTGIKDIKVNNPRRFEGAGLGMRFRLDKGFMNPLDIASEIGISEEDFTQLLSEVNLELTKKKLRVAERDQLIIQAVSCMDDLEEVSNRLVERLREWNSLNFPELNVLVKTHELYAEVVSGKDLDSTLAERIKNVKKESYGFEFQKNDLDITKIFSDSILALYSTKEETEKYIDAMMAEIAPNLAALAGPLLGARLIAIAGSLKRLCMFPASTIQVLGAEDAFFRFLKTKKNPPKHGIIFQLPEIRSAQKKNRGKISRTFAAKLAIAARADYFKGEFIGDKLRKDFLGKIEKLK